jgi:transcriptional regulator with XRE-family HTH domain
MPQHQSRVIAYNLNLSIGQVIKQRVDHLGISKAELARRLHMSPANIHKIFKRKSVDVKLLCQIGEILGYDFLSLYRPGESGPTIGNLPFEQDIIVYHLQNMRSWINLATEILDKLITDDSRPRDIALESRLAAAREMLAKRQGLTDAG